MVVGVEDSSLNEEVAKLCNRRMIPYSPGCGSASEISDAQALGCEIVKVFPGKEVGGPNFVKNVMGPMPWTRIMPTGGVDSTEESLTAWLSAGVAAADSDGSRLHPSFPASRARVVVARQEVRAGRGGK